jgi:cytoskeletal protein CcmA (bactofilin family)
MFAKKSEHLPNDRDIKAFLEEGCEFEGKLSFSGVVRLNGKFRGEIHSSDTLIIGESAIIEGVVHVGALILGGRIKGTIVSEHRAEILATGVFEGKMQASSLVVKEGATILGELEIRQEAHSQSTSNNSTQPAASA